MGAASAYSTELGIAAIVTGRLDETDHLRGNLGLDTAAGLPSLVREAYRKWGPQEFAGHLYGDFSIVLWDSGTRRLVLTRSPSGLHPLFYVQRGPELVFGSSPQALPGESGLAVSVDEQALAEWLVLRPRLSDRTLLAGVRRVTPGTSLHFEEGRLTVSQHWRPESLATLHLRDHQEYADAIRETLRAAVVDRLREVHGTVATQLSGGLDSSSVTALTAEHLATRQQKVFAFTAVPGEISSDPVQGRFFDESTHAAAVADRFRNIEHVRVSTGKVSLFQVLDKYTDAEAGAPFNPHHLQWIDQTYAAAAAKGAATMLTGSMGNMTISASGSYAPVDALQHGRWMQAARLFAADRRSKARALRHVPGMLLTAFAPGVLDVGDRIRHTRMNVEEFTGMRPEFAASHGIDLKRWNRRMPFATARELALHSLDRFDFGMFHEAPRRLYGLDVTDPTYDRRVAELTLRIPLEQFCANGVPRGLIRTAMQGHLPDVVRLERRRGLQSADFLAMLDRERAAIAGELDRMSEIDLLQRAINVPLLKERLGWTAKQAIDYGWNQYSNRLMRAISVGRFVRRLMEGSLFTTLPPSHDQPGTFHIQM